MKERARDQGGPGTLTDELATPDLTEGPPPGESLADLAAEYQLRPSSARPGVFAYAGQRVRVPQGVAEQLTEDERDVTDGRIADTGRDHVRHQAPTGRADA